MTQLVDPQKIKFTQKQGQYLAFIHYYIKMNGIPPAHTDFQKYFKVTPPSVNQMLITLEKNNLIRRKPKTPRVIEILIPVEDIPALI